MRVIRLVVYEGSEEWIERTLAKSIKGKCQAINPTIGKITAITLGSIPDDLEIFIKEEESKNA
jgi:hypothetical protein